MPDLLTLPGYFLSKGYLTVGAGKIFHENVDSGCQDWNHSWSPEGINHAPLNGTAGCPEGLWDASPHPAPYAGPHSHEGQGPAIYAYPPNVTDDMLIDGMLARHTVATLSAIAANRKAKRDSRNFFVAAGFHRPHIPWLVPEKYFQHYPLENITLAPHVYEPTNADRNAVPHAALTRFTLGCSLVCCFVAVYLTGTFHPHPAYWYPHFIDACY
jgi:hypothetical protein